MNLATSQVFSLGLLLLTLLQIPVYHKALKVEFEKGTPDLEALKEGRFYLLLLDSIGGLFLGAIVAFHIFFSGPPVGGPEAGAMLPAALGAAAIAGLVFGLAGLFFAAVSALGGSSKLRSKPGEATPEERAREASKGVPLFGLFCLAVFGITQLLL